MSELKIFKTLFCFTEAERQAISSRSSRDSRGFMSEFKIFKTLFCLTDADRAAISLRSRQGSQLDNSMTDVDSGIQSKTEEPVPKKVREPEPMWKFAESCFIFYICYIVPILSLLAHWLVSEGKK